MGQLVEVQIEIYKSSTPQDRQLLIEAFEKGQNKGLVDALKKMKAVGRCSITGTVGDHVAFIDVIPTPTGRKSVSLPTVEYFSAKNFSIPNRRTTM